MSKLSETVTSTPEEKWGLMADAESTATTSATKAEKPKVKTPKVETPKVEKATAEESKAEEPKVEKTKEAKAKAEKVSLEKEPPAEQPEEKAAAAAEVAETKKRASWRRVLTIRRIAVGALVVVAIAAIVVAAILGVQLKEERDIDAAADEARAAAEQYAVTLTSVSSDNLDANFAAVLDGATGEFKDMYSQSSGQLRDLLVENKANAQGKVIDSGIKSATTSKVEVMLFVDQTVTNTATPDARIDRSRVLMTMEKIDGRWLASKVDLP